MIVFLTLAYLGLLAVLVKLKIIRLNLGWKLSPILWMLFIFVVLFVPMQWGAPSGPVEVFRYAIEIVPEVTGQVTDVPVVPLTEIKQGDVLFQINPEPFQHDVRRLEAALVDAEQQPELLASAVAIAKSSLAKATAVQEDAKSQLERSAKLRENQATTEEDYEDRVRQAAIADRSVEVAQAELEQAQLQLAAQTSSGENTQVAQVREQLERARYDLERTTVRAPTDGIVQQLALRPGARVAALPLRAALVFVETDRSRIAVAINQNQMRYVRPGQSAEIVLKYFPGRTLQAKVLGLAASTSGGQVQSGGVLQDMSTKQKQAEPYQVILEITDEDIEKEELRGGAVGIAAIYTDRATFSHIIRRVMLRMQAWTNYLF